MHKLAQSVLASIRRAGLMNPGDRVGVAASGGADSVALLRLLLELNNELGIVLSVVHFNHHIRGADSDSDEAFVIELAHRYELELHRSGDDVPSYAAAEHLSLEAAARRLRYRCFESLLRQGVFDRIATAHTLDDQAETVLLRLLRGAGTRGLGGIFPSVEVQPETPGASGVGHIVRPLLPFPRSELEDYLQSVHQEWRDDVTNLDVKHLRNRVRHRLLPLLEKEFTPAVRQRLADLAEIARSEEEYWQSTTDAALPTVTAGNYVVVSNLLAQPVALRRRVLRAASQRLGLVLEFEQVEEVLRLAESPSGAEKRIMLGDDWCALRGGDRLCFEQIPELPGARGYEYVLAIPGRVSVPEIGRTFEAAILPRENAGECSDQMLTSGLTQPFVVRNWRPGDRFFPAHSKSAKKLKELFQERHIPLSQRHLWPVILSGDEIVWVRNLPCPAHLLAQDGQNQVLVIREFAMEKSGLP